MLWCEAWSQEKKDAELRLYRARCKLQCLEANLTRIDIERFDELMILIEEARMELHAAFMANLKVSA